MSDAVEQGANDFARTLREVAILASETATRYQKTQRLVAPPYHYDNWEEIYGFPRPDWVFRSNDIPTKPPFDLKQLAQDSLNKAFRR